MAQYKTPNVYVREESTLPPSVAEVATAIPAFIGYTELTTDKKDDTISLINKPVRITNMSEFEVVFGGAYKETISVDFNDNAGEYYVRETEDTALPDFFLYQAVQHFFANGGGACYVVSTGGYFNGDVKTVKLAEHFKPALEAIAQVDEVTLFVMPETVTLDAHGESTAHYDLHNTALTQASKLQDRFAIIDVKQASVLAADQRDDAEVMRNKVVGDLKYGAAYYPYLRSSIPRSYSDESVNIKVMMTNKEEDGSDTKSEAFVTLAELNNPESPHSSTAKYNTIKAMLRKYYLVLPPSAAVAGAIAKTDASRGVWKAPANVALMKVIEPAVTIDNSQQEYLNVDETAGKSVNAIRAFVGKGNLIWGARTLAGNDLEWRYVSVRRLFNMVEESLQKATAFAVFEPNTPFTWLKLKTIAENYLRNLWKQGALMGASESQAFFVQVGLGESMTEQDILEGLMKIKIGLAASRPAEFIELTFQHKSLEG